MTFHKKSKKRKGPDGKFVSASVKTIPKLDPRQVLFKTYYTEPTSPTFSNALQSAIRAGYPPNYAKNITAPVIGNIWVKDNVVDKYRLMLEKAESNLKEAMEMDVKEKAVGAFGFLYEKVRVGKKTIKKPIYRDNIGKLKIKIDVSKFATERLNKKTWGQDGIGGNTFILNMPKNQFNAIIARRNTIRRNSSERKST
jgi:hypothetical protein